MASKQPTCQQLAYLDELKQRLQDLRLRQETFMEETAEILRNISSDQPVPPKAQPSKAPVKPTKSADDKGSVGNIKQLIQRFEDLRQTSRQFSDQAMPEELLGVDVRKLLRGYENLIDEGNILHKNWMLLKKTTESCARQGNKAELMLKQQCSKFSSFAEQPNDAQLKVLPSVSKSLKFSIEPKTEKHAEKFKNKPMQSETSTESQPGSMSRINRSHSSGQIEISINSTQTNYENVKDAQSDYDNKNQQRFGALLQLILRVSPFNKCVKLKPISSYENNKFKQSRKK